MAINREETPIVTENDDFSVQNATEIAGRPSNAISSSGWDTPAAGGGNYPVDFKFIDGQFQIVKFIDPSATPFASYKEHWLTQKTSGKRSYISLGSNDPLCVKLGSVPRHITLYAAHHNQQFGPLNRSYWALSRTGEMAAITYQVNPVKERDLQEDWGIDLAAVTPIVNEMQAYDSSIFKAPTWDELEAIANALS